MNEPSAPEPATVVDVTIERAASVTITFDDGLICMFPVADLRAGCPCATCRNVRERGDFASARPDQVGDISIAGASFVGAWGLSITWSDGHNTGIYAWLPLRRWWLSGLQEPLTEEA